MRPTREHQSLLQGTQFEVEKRLAGGAMGEVFLVVHRLLRTKLCVKVLHEELLADEGLVDRFRVEAQSLGQLGGGTHPHLVHVRDFGVTPAGLPYLAMEFLEGKTLLELRKARGEIPWREACDWVIQALRGVRVAHEAGIVHRDLKPANLFLSQPEHEPPRVKVLDFGIAKIVSSDAPVERGAIPTAAGLMLGTPRYAAPEQVRAESIDARTDIYAMGLVLYELLTGKPPYADHKSQHDIMIAQAREVLLPPSRICQQALPPVIDEIVARATAKDPERRFQRAQDLSRALEAALEEADEPLALGHARRGRAGTVALDQHPLAPVAQSAPDARTAAQRRTAVASAAEQEAFAEASDRTDHAVPWFPVEKMEISGPAVSGRAATQPGPGSITVAEMTHRRQRRLVFIAGLIGTTLLLGALLWWAFSRYLG